MPVSDDDLGGFDSSNVVPLSRAAGSFGTNPDSAGKAVQMSQGLGLPPSVIGADLETFQQVDRGQKAAAAIERNGWISDYVARNPMAAEVSADDYDNLEKVSKAVQPFTVAGRQGGLLQAAPEFFLHTVPEMATLLTSEAGRAKLIRGLGKYGEHLADTLGTPGQVQSQGFDIHDPADLDKALGLGLLIGLGKQAPKIENFPRLGRSTSGEIDAFLHDAAGRQTRQEIDDFLAGKAAPDKDPKAVLQIEYAKADAAKLDDAVAAAEATNTKARAPSMLEDFIAGHETENLQLPAAQIADLYRAEGKVPAEGDGLFGFVPGLARDLPLGIETGVELTVPASKYIAHIDPAVHDKIKDFVRFRPEGVTVTEAKELNTNKIEPVENAPPSTVDHDELGLRPLFSEPPPEMTKPEFERYNRRIQYAQQTILDKATTQVERQKDARQTVEWKAREAEVKVEMQTAIAARPDVATESFLKKGKFKLDSEAVNRILPDNSIPAALKTAGAAHPDDIAPFVGFNSGAELIKGLNDLIVDRKARNESPTRQLDRLINEATAREMETRHGDFGRQIAEEARALALDDIHFDVLSDELRVLASQAGGRPPMGKAELKEWVGNQFASLDTKAAANFTGFQKAAGRAGRDAEKALLAGDPVEAFKAKQRQILSWLLAKESNKFAKEIEKIAGKIDRVQGKTEIASMDQTHFDQLRSMLASVGFTPKHSIPEGLASLADFVEQSNGQLAVAGWLQDGLIRVNNPSKLTAQQMRELGESITSMMHVGRAVQKIDSAYTSATVDNVAIDVKAELDRFDLIKQPLNKNLRQRAGSILRKINAAHALPELIMDYTDQFNPQGPLSQFVDRPLRASNNKEIEMTEDVNKKLRMLQKYTDNSIMDSIPNDLIIDPHTGAPLDINRRNLRQLIGYMGSKSGIEKVTRGFGVEEVAVWKLINDNATKADWQWVAGMHDIFRDIYKEAREMYIRDTGVAPDEVRALPMKSEKFGDFPGGYWPINYDKTRSNIDPHVFAKYGPFGPDYRPAIPPNSYTKSRTGYQDFLDLSGFLLDSEIRSMVHDIAFRESIRNANKLITNKIFSQEMTKKWGKEYADLFPKWLEDIAGSHKYDDAYAQGWARASAFLRQNIVSALTWVAPSTIEKHGISAAAMSVGEVGRGIFPAFVRIAADGMIDAARTIFRTKPELPTPEMTQAIKDIIDPGERGETTRQFIMDSSAVVRSRQKRFADSIKGAYEPSIYSPSSMVLWDARQMSMNIGRFPIAFVDAMSAYPTWLVAYKKAIMETGGDKAQAVYEADKAMSRAHGSTSILDRSALMRSGELMRWMTSLFGFWNHNTNIRMRIAWDIAGMTKGREEPGATAGQIGNKMFWALLIPLIAEEWATPYLDEDRRSWGKRAFQASLRFFGGGYVGLRELTNGFAHGMEPSVGMMSTFLKTIDMAWKDIAKGNKGKNAMIHEVTAFSFLTGLGGAQLGRTGSYIKDRITGQERPGTIGQTLQGIRTGHSKARIHK